MLSQIVSITVAEYKPLPHIEYHSELKIHNDMSIFRRIITSIGHSTHTFFFYITRWTFKVFYLFQTYLYPSIEQSIWDSFEPVYLTDMKTNEIFKWTPSALNNIWYEKVGSFGSVIDYKSLKTGFHYKVFLREGSYPIDIGVSLQQSKTQFLNDQKHILFGTARDSSTRECFDIVDELNEFSGPNGTFAFNCDNYVADVVQYFKRKYGIHTGEMSWMNMKGEEFQFQM